MKSSAVLIALIIGTVLTALLALAILDSKQNLIMVEESNDRVLAEMAARSGIEAGRLRYEELISTGKLDEVYTNHLQDPDYSYDLSVRMNSLSYGKEFSAGNWLDREDKAKDQGAIALEDGGSLDIDLVYLYKFSNPKEKPTDIKIKFSNPFINGEKANSPSTVSYELLDRTGGERLSNQEEHSDKGHVLKVDNLSKCINQNVSCMLKIYVSSQTEAVTYLKIQAKSSKGVIESSEDIPGTVIIDSIGSYRKSSVDMEAKYSSLGGNYLGIFNHMVK